MLGWTEILVIASVGVVAFNFRRLPAAVKSVKDSVKLFKSALNGDEEKRPTREINPPKD